MFDESYGDNPTPDRGDAESEGIPAPTFEPMFVAFGPSNEYWLRHLIFIRGAAAALRFDDRVLTERMRSGFRTNEDALDAVRAWADTERQLAAVIEILRMAQARCTLASSRVDRWAGDTTVAGEAKGAVAKV